MSNINPAVQGGLGVAGAITVTKSFLTLGTSLGWWTVEMAEAWALFFNDVLPIGFMAVGVLWVARRTTSLADPRDKDGEELTKSNGAPAIEKLAALHEQAIVINKMQDRGLN